MCHNAFCVYTQTHKARGGKVQLPIGMNTAEPWLLNAVDVQALLAGVQMVYLAAAGWPDPAAEHWAAAAAGTAQLAGSR
jgi:hypothetical protein